MGGISIGVRTDCVIFLGHLKLIKCSSQCTCMSVIEFVSCPLKNKISKAESSLLGYNLGYVL